MYQSLVSLWMGCVPSACSWAQWLMLWHQEWKVPPSGHITSIVFWMWVLDELWKLITPECIHSRPLQQPYTALLHRMKFPTACPQRGTFGTYYASSCLLASWVSIFTCKGLINTLGVGIVQKANKLDSEAAVPVGEHISDRFQHLLNLWAPDILEEATFQISSLPAKFMGLYKLFSQELLKSLYLTLCLK